MNRLIITILSFFIFSALFAQKEIDLYWGNELMFRKNVEFNKVIGMHDNKLIVLSSSGDVPKNSINVNLEIYNAETLDYFRGISIVENKSDENFEEVVISDDKILVFTSHYDRELSLKVLNVQEYDLAENELGEIKRVDEVSTFDKSDVKSFNISSSPDGHLILIYHDNPSSSGNKVFNLKVINDDFTIHWEKEFALNYKEKMVNYSDILIDDNSNVYLLSTINPFGINRATGLGSLVNVKSTLFSYRPKEDKLKEFEFALSRNWIDEVSIEFDDEQNVIASAFYTYPNDYKIRGFVLFEMNSFSGEVVAKKMVTLEKDEFKKVDNSIRRLKEYSRNLVGSSSIYPGSSSHMNTTSTEFIMKDIVIDRQNIVLAVEAFRRDERCTESFNDQQMIVDCQKNFLYGDVMLFFFNRNFEIIKISHVQKLQLAVNRLSSYYSFSLMKNEEGIYVFYNDDYRNVGKEESSELKTPLTNMKKSLLNIDAFTHKGDRIDFTIGVGDEERLPFYPIENMTLSDKDFLLYSQKEKNYKFGKLSIR